MARFILIDEFHLTIAAAHGLPESTYAAIRRRLNARPFQTDLRNVIRVVSRRYPSLRKARVRVTR